MGNVGGLVANHNHEITPLSFNDRAESLRIVRRCSATVAEAWRISVWKLCLRQYPWGSAGLPRM